MLTLRVDFSPETRRKPEANEIEAMTEILKVVEKEKPSKADLEKIKRLFAKKYGLSRYPRNSDILKQASDDIYQKVLPYLRIRNIRSISGVNVISVFTAPFACRHGACIFCPGGPSWGTPMSYTGREPGAMRAIANGFDPVAQIRSRIDQLQATGHNAEKIDIIVMGGTFNSNPREYQDEFMIGVYEGLNGERSETIEDAKKLNETAKHRCIGLTFETKPDWSKASHIKKMLEYGVTRVEIGVQTLQEDVLEFVNRGHTLQDTKDSFKALRDAGLKITAHMMPGLPGTTPETDIQDFKTLYQDPDYIPDEMKIYPTQVIENTELAQMVIDGKFNALSNEQTFEIMKQAKLLTPPFIRIKRALRDLPITLVIDGPTWGDMRQRIQNNLKEIEDLRCRCIRCREIGLHIYKENPSSVGEMKQKRRTYEAGGGTEHFLSYEDEDEILAGFLRLRFPSTEIPFEVLQDSAIVRELHVYGSALAIGERNSENLQSFQHKGFGRKLLSWSEDMSRSQGFKKLAVISGVGVREYYSKLGYNLQGYYMIKELL